jgi:Beta-propeller repeat
MPLALPSTGTANAFVTKLSGDGSELVYSTYLGGSGFDAGGAIAVDWSGKAYVTGDASSMNFPTTPGAFQTSYGGGADDVFVSELNPSGTALVYSTYLGGALDDYANAIAIDTAGQAYVTGFTNSTNFPTTPDAYDQTYNGDVVPAAYFYGDAFVTKLNRAGTALIYSTYLGGTGDDLGLGIATDRARKVYVTGSTNSADFPITPGAYDTKYNGAGPPYFYGDAFVTKLDVPTGEAGCDKADGDGEADDQSSGRKSHFHFHKKSSCPDQTIMRTTMCRRTMMVRVHASNPPQSPQQAIRLPTRTRQ